MQRKSVVLSLTPLAAAAALFVISAEASAQDAGADPGTQTVVVQGIRASMQQAINQKRNADSYVEVITAEDVGKLADKNVADSLQRLPGVSVAAAGGSEGAFGENDRVALRGTPSSLTLTTMGGHSISSGDWFADNIINGGRSVSFSLFPAELIGRITVHKGSEASLIEGGANGVVDIDTNHPLDLLRKKNVTGGASIGAMHSEYAGKTDPQLSAFGAWRNDDSTFGVLIQGFYHKRHLSRVAQENTIWYAAVDPGSPVANAIPGSTGAIMSYLGGTAWFEQTRTRKGGLVELQWKPSKDASLSLTGFTSHLDAPNANHNFMQAAGRFLGNAWAPPANFKPAITGTISNGVFTNFSATPPADCATSCAGVSAAVQDVFGRPVAESQSRFVTLDGRMRLNDAWTVSGKLGTTKGGGNTESAAIELPMPFTAISYQNHGVDSPVTYTTAGSSKYSIGGGYGGVPSTYGSHVTSNDQETYGQLDLERKLDMDFFRTVKFGVRAANHERSLAVINNSGLPGFDDPKNVPLGGLISFPGYLSDVAGKGSDYWTLTAQSVFDWTRKYTAYTAEAFQNEFSIKEPTKSAYVQLDFGNDSGLSGNVGVRFAHTSEDVTKYEIGPTGSFAPRQYKNSYDDYLPSLNIRYQLTNDVILRTDVSRTMARPELGAMAGIDLRDQQMVGTTGNPNLTPIRASNFDVGVEWYFMPQSLLAANYFFAHLDGYVSYGASKGTFYNQQQKKYTEYATSSPINSQGVVKGLELNYIQSLPMGFGYNVNYTYTNGAETGHMPGSACGAAQYQDCTMIGTSKNAYNVGAYFETNRFSARVTYSWRSGWLNGFSRNTAQYQAGEGTLTATASYKLSDNLTLSLDGKDLNNPMHRSVYKTPGVADLPGSFYKNGRQIFLTLSGRM